MRVLDNGTMVALGWTLLHFCWQGTAIAMFYGIADQLTQRASANARYLIALTAVLLMPLAAIVTYVDQSRLVVHVSHDGETVTASQLGALHQAIVKEIPVAAPVVQQSELWISWNSDRLLPWVDGIWLIGVLMLALRAAGGWWQLEAVRRRATGIVPAELQQSFQRINQQLRTGRNVALRFSGEVISPLAMGVWRTAVILPASIATQLTPEEIESVLAHELAHIRRWDYITNLLQTAIESLLFFHPAVWWLSHRTRHLREICCDAVAARTCDDPVIYAQALLRLEEERTQRLRLAVALNNGQTPLLGRVKQILGEGWQMETGMKSGVQAAVAGAVVVCLMLTPKMAEGLKQRAQVKPIPSPMMAESIDVPQVMPEPAAAPSTGRSVAASLPAADPMPTPQPEPDPSPLAIASPSPVALPAPVAVVANVAPVAQVAPIARTAVRTAMMQDAKSGAAYLQQMKDAGYPLDLDKDLDQIIALRSVGVTPEYAKTMSQAGYGTPTPKDLISLKSVGVTPEYAKSMAQAGYGTPSMHDLVGLKSVGVTPDYAKSIAQLGIGTPSLHDLVGLRSVGVTPEYVASLKNSGIAPASLHEVISEKSMGITSDYARQIAALGYGTPTVHDLVSLKSMGITPEYAAGLKSSGIPVQNLHELVSIKSVGVTPEYAKNMAAAGFTNLSTHDLVSLKAMGLTPEYTRWVKQTFPDADAHAVRQAVTFHIDEAFIAKAKAHGFTSTSLDKLVKLKIAGLLED
ncbi:M56 family metallopeptidase [Terriglobus tenax]|uniref:M56 family metallopeptidase n=1 Tax=Terriglobus tenax TaxID=1111115 RepID=UPI0021E0E4B3|nr:M56 family metallopeptidase [Terriglobus tenax]